MKGVNVNVKVATNKMVLPCLYRFVCV